MDVDGVWRSPEEWPEDYPPIDGWQRDANGRWQPPEDVIDLRTGHDLSDDDIENDGIEKARGRSRPIAETAGRPPLAMSRYQAQPDVHETSNASTTKNAALSQRRSTQANADIRAMLLVGGAIGVAVLLLVAAIVLQSRAGAAEQGTTPSEVTSPPEVVFAAETDAVREQRRQAARQSAPANAISQLGALEVQSVEQDLSSFDEELWVASTEGCLDSAERVLVARSTVPITWADNLQCVASEGRWTDLYLGTDLTRTIDAEVRSLIPIENVHLSGGSEWTPATRNLFLNDTSHPATMVILAANSGHNPRGSAPDVWRPSNQASWCGYAVDWVSVKARWELRVSPAEADALAEMLATCDQPDSTGAHAASMVIEPIESPTIDRINAE